MTVRGIQQRPGRTNFDTVSTLGTVEPTKVGANYGVCSTTSCFNSVLAHPLVANSSAAFAKDATLRVVGDHRRKIPFRRIIFLFGEALFQTTPFKRHFLEFAFTATIANGTIKRMVRQKKLSHAALSFFDLFTLCRNNHSVGTSDGAGRLQLRHLLDPYEAHPARSLQRQIGVITERGNVEALVTTNVDQPGILRYLEW